jgi:hypothetical protein
MFASAAAGNTPDWTRSGENRYIQEGNETLDASYG